MTLSLSVFMFSCFCSSLFFLLVSLKFFLFLKSFIGASRLLKGCLKCKECFKEVLRVFTERFKGLSRKFKECFKEVSRMLQESFRKILRAFQESFMGVTTKIEGCIK